MSFGKCSRCENTLTLEEYNLAKYTNRGKGGLCMPCLVKTLVEYETMNYEIQRLQADSEKLDALEQAGVDNWEGFSQAMDILAEIRDTEK
jgi:hypothetical protein